LAGDYGGGTAYGEDLNLGGYARCAADAVGFTEGLRRTIVCTGTAVIFVGENVDAFRATKGGTGRTFANTRITGFGRCASIAAGTAVRFVVLPVDAGAAAIFEAGSALCFANTVVADFVGSGIACVAAGSRAGSAICRIGEGIGAGTVTVNLTGGTSAKSSLAAKACGAVTNDVAVAAVGVVRLKWDAATATKFVRKYAGGSRANTIDAVFAGVTCVAAGAAVSGIGLGIGASAVAVFLTGWAVAFAAGAELTGGTRVGAGAAVGFVAVGVDTLAATIGEAGSATYWVTFTRIADFARCTSVAAATAVFGIAVGIRAFAVTFGFAGAALTGTLRTSEAFGAIAFVVAGTAVVVAALDVDTVFVRTALQFGCFTFVRTCFGVARAIRSAKVYVVVAFARTRHTEFVAAAGSPASAAVGAATLKIVASTVTFSFASCWTASC